MTETAQQPVEAGHLNATLGLGSVTLFGLAYIARLSERRPVAEAPTAVMA